MGHLFFNFMAQALVPVLLFYGIASWVLNASGVSKVTHAVAIGAVCFATAIVRLGAAGLFGGAFALGHDVLWAFLVPGALSLAAAWIVARIGARDDSTGLEPAPTAPASVANDVPATASAQPRRAPSSPAPAGRPATPAGVLLMVGAIVGGGLVLVLVGLLWLVVAAGQGQGQGAGSAEAAQGQSPAAAAPRQIVDPFKDPPKRGDAREADPMWRAVRADWETRNQMWLEVPGAREALEDAIVVEEARGEAVSYPDLLARAVSRAQRELYEKQRRSRGG